MKTHIAINGACGRMGQRLVALAKEEPDLAVTAAVDWAQNPHLGRDAGELAGIGSLGVPVRGELPLDARVDVVIDFSTPEGTMAILPVCVDRKLPVVIATTGHDADQKRDIEAAAHQTAVLFSPNRVCPGRG
jgi:4-hydroxy-tetrahydrodipicolinate reductase